MVSLQDRSHITSYIKKNTRDVKLERCGKVRDLGVIIDSKLTFEDNIAEDSKF